MFVPSICFLFQNNQPDFNKFCCSGIESISHEYDASLRFTSLLWRPRLRACGSQDERVLQIVTAWGVDHKQLLFDLKPVLAALTVPLCSDEQMQAPALELDGLDAGRIRISVLCIRFILASVCVSPSLCPALF